MRLERPLSIEVSDADPEPTASHLVEVGRKLAISCLVLPLLFNVIRPPASLEAARTQAREALESSAR